MNIVAHHETNVIPVSFDSCSEWTHCRRQCLLGGRSIRTNCIWDSSVQDAQSQILWLPSTMSTNSPFTFCVPTLSTLSKPKAANNVGNRTPEMWRSIIDPICPQKYSYQHPKGIRYQLRLTNFPSVQGIHHTPHVAAPYSFGRLSALRRVSLFALAASFAAFPIKGMQGTRCTVSNIILFNNKNSSSYCITSRQQCYYFVAVTRLGDLLPGEEAA